MRIRVEYIATLEEYYSADTSFRSVLNKKPIDLYMYIILGIIAIAFMAMGQIFIGSIIAIIVYVLHQGYSKRWIVRRNFNNMAHGGETEVLTFTEDEIFYECGIISERIKWDAYAAYLETETLFLLFYNGSDHYAIIPKRAIVDEQELIKLHQLLMSQLANYEVNDV